MRADDIYRFVVLRHVASRPQGELAQPFVAAYGSGDQAVEAEGVRASMATALRSRDSSTLRTIAQQALDQGTSAWDRVSDDALREVLRSLVPIGSTGRPTTLPKTAVDWLLLPLGETNRNEARQRLGNQRALLTTTRHAAADLLSAYAVLGEGSDGDGAAFVICACESLERLLVRVEERVNQRKRDDEVRLADDEAAIRQDRSWQAPLLGGVVVLPYDVGSSQPASTRSPMLRARLDVSAGGDDEGWDSVGPPPSFVGDLIVLKQQLRRYSLGEIAHVENVMAKEHLSRTFRTLRREESRLLSTSDSEKEVSHDRQTTTRDELRTEIDTAMSEQLDLSASFNVSASYMGPSVSVTATVGAAVGYRRSSEERTSTATAHTQEVVSRASERIRERTITERERIELSEREDTSVHGFENDTTGHLVGIYRWLEKDYDLHLINYGRRRIYEFAVPEPAAFWMAAVDERGVGLAGPAPEPPKIGNPAHDLTASDLALRGGDGALLDQPAGWQEVVALAAEWEVTLPEPPATTRQVHYVLQVPGESNADTEKAIARFGNDKEWFYESGIVSRQSSDEPLKVPDGYAATSGHATLHGFMYVRKRDANYKQFERGYGFVYINGRIGNVTSGVAPGDGTYSVTFPDGTLVPQGTTIEGDVPLAIATTLNGVALTVRLDCVRTPRKEREWVDSVLAAFGSAYSRRVADWEEEGLRATATNRDWSSALPEATMRAIEKRELKRAITSQVTRGGIDGVGDAILPPVGGGGDPVLPPAIQPASLDLYRRALRFFEQVFDWNNMAYSFVDYPFARQERWSELATLDNADAQFRKFLAAGGARVQLPVRLGYETHAEYFFSDLIRDLSLDSRLPWLASMSSIAEDLAADAREGFTLGDGRVAVTQGQATVAGTATRFSASVDTRREIRIGGAIYVIDEVVDVDEVRIDPPYRGATAASLSYELGGIVVGSPIPLRLPTTLIAIDTDDVELPTFPPRYAS
jgi:hypothetical protein